MNIKKIIFFLLGLYVLIIFFDIEDKIYSEYLKISNDKKGITNRVDLDSFKVQIEAKEVENIEDNLSGISYNENTKTLFAVTNRPRKIHELDLEGNYIREINLKGFKDTEGIVHVKDNTFAVIDERFSSLYLVELTEDTKEIDKKNVIKKFKLQLSSYKNFGYEGIAYNSIDDIFYIANELFSKKIITIQNWLSEKETMQVSLEAKENSVLPHLTDLSGLHYDERTKTLLVLSDESHLLAEVNNQGDKISFLDLEKNFAGLKADIPQAEGVTMDEEGNLYIVSEPNLFYKFKK